MTYSDVIELFYEQDKKCQEYERVMEAFVSAYHSGKMKDFSEEYYMVLDALEKYRG